MKRPSVLGTLLLVVVAAIAGSCDELLSLRSDVADLRAELATVRPHLGASAGYVFAGGEQRRDVWTRLREDAKGWVSVPASSCAVVYTSPFAPTVNEVEAWAGLAIVHYDMSDAGVGCDGGVCVGEIRRWMIAEYRGGAVCSPDNGCDYGPSGAAIDYPADTPHLGPLISDATANIVWTGSAYGMQVCAGALPVVAAAGVSRQDELGWTAPTDAGADAADASDASDAAEAADANDSGGGGSPPTLNAPTFPLFQSAAGGGPALALTGTNLTSCLGAHVCGTAASVTCPTSTTAQITPPVNAHTSSPSCSITITTSAGTSAPVTSAVAVISSNATRAWACGQGFSSGSWVDLIGGADPTTAEGAPTLDTSWSGSCAIAFNGSQGLCATFSAIAQPDSVFVIGDYTAVGGAGAGVWFDSDDSTARQIAYVTNAGDIDEYAGSVFAATTLSPTVTFLGEFNFNGASSYVSIMNGAPIGGNPGAQSFHGICLGQDVTANVGEALIGHLAMLIVDPAVTSSDQADFCGYASSIWGLSCTP